jgi:DNA-binding NarL/FixJ family response regulator
LALAQLTKREKQVLNLIGQGLSNSAISQQLGISHDTVKSHVRAILEKLDVADRTQAAVYAVRNNLGLG